MPPTIIATSPCSEGERTIRVFRPGGRFPSVSVTGRSCSLMCDHCNGSYLKGMVDVSTKGSLYDFGMELWKKGGTGLLISGGCDPSGSVEFSDHTLQEARRLKEGTSLVLNFHTGLLDSEGADRIASSLPDMVSLDIVADREVVNDIFHLDAGLEDYRRTYDLLVERGIRVVPHVLAGLRPSVRDLEERAIDLIEPFSPEAAVLISFIPTKGTPMGKTHPAPASLVLGTAKAMREDLRGKLYLGCMRPKGDASLEIDVLELGFDGIVQPSRATMEWMRGRGFSMEELEQCCAAL